MREKKTQEQRIKAATEYLHRTCQSPMDPVFARSLAEGMLEAADAPPRPKWPTDESGARFKAAYRSSTNSDLALSDEWLRDCLREAMLVDKINKAAVVVRDTMPETCQTTKGVLRLVRAVNEAGL